MMVRTCLLWCHSCMRISCYLILLHSTLLYFTLPIDLFVLSKLYLYFNIVIILWIHHCHVVMKINYMLRRFLRFSTIFGYFGWKYELYFILHENHENGGLFCISSMVT